MPRTSNWSDEFNCSYGSKQYELRLHARQMRTRYGIHVYKHERKCKRCRRWSTLIHKATGLTMQCFQLAQLLGHACDGTPLEGLPSFEEHRAIEQASNQNPRLRAG